VLTIVFRSSSAAAFRDRGLALQLGCNAELLPVTGPPWLAHYHPRRAIHRGGEGGD